jgi:hydroxymethylbilane synthase
VPRTLRLATRGSVLALIQARTVADLLESASPGLTVEVVPVSTPGDRDKRTPLTTLGQGVFVKGVEEMLLDGRADLAVHSLKDVPTTESPGLALGAFPVRADPRDGLVCRVGRNLLSLPSDATVATGSPRRAAQLLALRPDVRIVPVRGNLDTRLRKLRDGEFDALTVAVAGLERLDRLHELDQAFEADECTPAAGQGTLVAQVRADDPNMRGIVDGIDVESLRAASLAERAFLAALGGGCELPAGALAEVTDDGRLVMIGVVASADGKRLVRERHSGSSDDPSQAGVELAQTMLRQARDVLGATIRGV